MRDLREEGIEPLAIVAVLATLGTGHAPVPDLDRLTRDLDLAAFTTSQPKLDPEALQRTSAAVLHAMPFAEAAARLALPALDERFWTAVRPNLTRLAEALDWWAICREPLAPVIEDAAFLAQAADTLPESVNEPEAVATWLKRLGELSGPARAGALPPAAAGAHGPGAWTGAQASATADRPPPRLVPPARPDRLKP